LSEKYTLNKICFELAAIADFDYILDIYAPSVIKFSPILAMRKLYLKVIKAVREKVVTQSMRNPPVG